MGRPSRTTIPIAALILALVIAVPTVSRSFTSINELRLLTYASDADHGELWTLLSQSTFRPETLGRALLLSSGAVASEPGMRIETADLLLAKGAWVNYSDHAGTTPLIAAVRNGHFELARFLLEAGADPDMEDAAGKRPSNHIRRELEGSGDMLALLKSESALRADLTANPIVMNVRTESSEVDVVLFYDMLGDSKSCVIIAVKPVDGDAPAMPAAVVSGDVGCEVIPGRNLSITWHARSRYPDDFDASRLALDLVASSR